MKHPTDDTLRAYVDGELAEANQTAAHLASCPGCRARLEAIGARTARVNARLAALAPAQNEPPRTPQHALMQFKKRKENAPMINNIFSRKLRSMWIGLTVAAVLAVAFTFPPVQAWAANFLGLFRVQQIQVIEVDTSRLSEINNDSTLAERIGELFSDSFKVTKEPGEPAVVASAEEAGALAGFTVRLPSGGESDFTLTVQDSASFEFTIDRVRAQAILDDAGIDDVNLPASLDTEPIVVNVPASVAAAYGRCPAPDMAEEEREKLSWDELRRCTVVTQMPSPTVSAPSDLDVARLAEVGLQFMGMSPEEAAQVSQSVDWATTLVIPIPQDAAVVEDVQVDGVTGTLMSYHYDGNTPSSYTLLWVKDGIIYGITGWDTRDAALEMANSMR